MCVLVVRLAGQLETAAGIDSAWFAKKWLLDENGCADIGETGYETAVNAKLFVRALGRAWAGARLSLDPARPCPRATPQRKRSKPNRKNCQNRLIGY